MSRTAVFPTGIVLGDLIPGARIRDAALIAVGACFTGAAAQVSIHTTLSPVPFTLQTMAVLVTGVCLGKVRGTLSMLAYAIAGIAGVPWYEAGTHGLGGPSFGYVVGFVVAAGVAGQLAEQCADRKVLTMASVMILGNLIIYAFGTVWLAEDLSLSLAAAVRLGVRPFLLADAVKVVMSALLVPGAWRLVTR